MCFIDRLMGRPDHRFYPPSPTRPKVTQEAEKPKKDEKKKKVVKK
jgi:hypothetical protein